MYLTRAAVLAHPRHGEPYPGGPHRTPWRTECRGKPRRKQAHGGTPMRTRIARPDVNRTTPAAPPEEL